MTLIWMEIVKEIYSKDKLITINKLSRKFLFCSSNDREKMDFYEHLKEIRDGIGNKNWAIFRKTSSCCIYIYSTNSGNLDRGYSRKSRHQRRTNVTIEGFRESACLSKRGIKLGSFNPCLNSTFNARRRGNVCGWRMFPGKSTSILFLPVLFCADQLAIIQSRSIVSKTLPLWTLNLNSDTNIMKH